MHRYRVRRYAGSEVSVEAAKEMCLSELKDKLWKDVWKGEIDLPGVKWTIAKAEDGVIEVIAEI